MVDENGLMVFVPEEAPAVLAGAVSNAISKKFHIFSRHKGEGRNEAHTSDI